MASQAKLEIAAMLGFSQTTTDTEGEQSRTNRVFSFSGSTPAGLNERITAWRKVSRMRSEITGTGDFERTESAPAQEPTSAGVPTAQPPHSWPTLTSALES